MKRLTILFCMAFGCLISSIMGQLSVNTAITLLDASSSETEECYSLQLEATTIDVPLSTQSYRLYYDASGLRFLRQKTQTLLDQKVYEAPMVVQAIHNANATGYGSLDFDRNIGFINVVITHHEGKNPVVIPAGEWVSTLAVCFERIGEQKQIVWARTPVTKGYATAFTQIGGWVNNKAVPVVIIEYGDFKNGVAPTHKISETIIRY